MPTAFSIPASRLSRLAALRHAAELADRGALAHIHLAVNGETARFTSTDGRLLAILRLSIDDFDGEPAEVVLDGSLFVAACTTLHRADGASAVRITIDRDESEVRLTRGTAVAITRIHDLRYPVPGGFIARFAGQTMVPAVASYAPSLLAAASRIIGARKTTLTLWSPSVDSDLARCWANGKEANDAPVSRGAVAVLVNQPGIWSDGELLVLLMPIRRDCSGAPDLSAFLSGCVVAEPVGSAA